MRCRSRAILSRTSHSAVHGLRSLDVVVSRALWLQRVIAIVICVVAANTAVAHPFHTSIAEVEWNSAAARFEVAMRVNSLELERALAAVHGVPVNLDNAEHAEPLVRNYVSERFSIRTADHDNRVTWVGMEIEKLDVWVYFEMSVGSDGRPSRPPRNDVAIRPAETVASTPKHRRTNCPSSVVIRNSVLTELNPLQVNFVNVTVANVTTSAHLTNETPAASLRLTDTATEQDFPAPANMERRIHITFDQPNAIDAWEPTDSAAWAVQTMDEDTYYALTKKHSDYSPEFRSPFNRSLLKDVTVQSFVLDVKMRSTIADYNHRDLCVFFGYQDDAHLYYVHLGKKTDDHANQIFIVNGAPRTKISLKTTDGIPWDDDWHKVRVSRDARSGRIEVFFDDMSTPVMTASDRTFTTGRVGIGSFDDTGHFDEFSVWVPQAD
jgi:Domain of unknown function (DUF6702)